LATNWKMCTILPFRSFSSLKAISIKTYKPLTCFSLRGTTDTMQFID
jgi:hypothetical protein